LHDRGARSRVSPSVLCGISANTRRESLARALRCRPCASALIERRIVMPNSRNPGQSPQQQQEPNVQNPGKNPDRQQQPQRDDDRMTADEEEE
jgi:hypothetical protein